MAYKASLIVGADGSCTVHVHDLMGCHTLASSKSRALAKVPGAIRNYFRWLTSHGERPRVGSARSRIVVAEEIRVRGNAGRAGGPDPLFDCDRVVATVSHVSRCLQLLRYLRRDLLQLVSDLPGKALDWKPEREPRSVRNTLQHIAEVDLWYLSRIRADPPYDRLTRKNLFAFLEHTRSLVHKTLPKLTETQRRKVFYPAKWGGTRYEWTATKVLHRLVTHERQHTNYLRRILNLPGAP